MTWHHVALGFAALGLVALCIHSPNCAGMSHDVVLVVGTTLGGIFGHATKSTTSIVHKDGQHPKDS